MRDLTIIYYSSNQEKPEFEGKIIDNLKQSAVDIPIISVTQKPIDLGQNICVGEVGVSDWNIAKQLYIGLLEAKTRYVCTAEADCLYSPGYFNFRPPEAMAYRLDNVWIWYQGSKVFRKKEFSLCSMFSEREYLIKQIEERFGTNIKDFRIRKKDVFYKYHNWELAHSDYPVINIKTPNGMRKFAGTNEVADKLPYWGTTENIKKLFKE